MPWHFRPQRDPEESVVCRFCSAWDTEMHMCPGKRSDLALKDGESSTRQKMADDAEAVAHRRWEHLRKLAEDVEYAVKHSEAVRRMEEALRRSEEEERRKGR